MVKKKKNSASIRLSNDIRKMVAFIKKDYEEMQKMHENGLKKSVGC